MKRGRSEVLSIVLAIICGAGIGLEREISAKVAGLRTNILICLGAPVLTIISKQMAGQVGSTGKNTLFQISALIFPLTMNSFLDIIKKVDVRFQCLQRIMNGAGYSPLPPLPALFFFIGKPVPHSSSTILHFFALIIFGLMTGRICLTYDESVLDDFYFIGAESLESGKLVSAQSCIDDNETVAVFFFKDSSVCSQIALDFAV